MTLLPALIARLLSRLGLSREPEEAKIARERRDWWEPELGRAVALLNADATAQRDWLHAQFPGWSEVDADELALHFSGLWMEGMIVHAQGVSDELRHRLDVLDLALKDMSGPERADFWTEDALATRPEWETIRVLAGRALKVTRREFAPPASRDIAQR